MIQINNFRKFASATSQPYTYADMVKDLQSYEGWGTRNNDEIYMDTKGTKDKYIPTMPGGVQLHPFVEQYLRKNLKYTGDLKVGSKIPRNISRQLQEWYLQNHVGVRNLEGFNKLSETAKNHLLQLDFNANLPNWPNFREALAAGNKAEIIKHLRDSDVWRNEQEKFKKGKKFTPRWTDTINAIEKEFGLAPATVEVTDNANNKLPKRPLPNKGITASPQQQSKETNSWVHPETGEIWTPEKLTNAVKSAPVIEI